MRQRRAQWIPVGVIALAVVIDLVTPTDVTSAPLLATAGPSPRAPAEPGPIVAVGGVLSIMTV